MPNRSLAFPVVSSNHRSSSGFQRPAIMSAIRLDVHSLQVRALPASDTGAGCPH